MEGYAVLEQGEGLTHVLERWFGPACRPEGGPELLIISPLAARHTPKPELCCHTVLLPGDAAGLLSGVRAAAAVSYGLSPRDTLTLSSRAGRRMCVAVQRELIRTDGSVLEQQELVVDASPRTDTLILLALVGAGLLLGES